MEKELNIAAILKDKPNARIYDLLHNIYVKLDNISTTDSETVIWCTKEYLDKTSYFGYSELGTERGWLDGLQILKPSKEMQDWSKFAWKKGDVLFDEKNDTYCFFDHFIDDEYLNICGKYLYNNLEDTVINDGFINDMTSDFEKVSDSDAEAIILNIERKLGGKLNLSTLQIEQPKPEFKDGDIVAYGKSVAICRKVYEHTLYFYASLDETLGLMFDHNNVSVEPYRLATDSEKQQLFDALAKEGKKWNPDTKQIEDLPKKCEFKPMDWCLMRDRCIRESWKLCQFGFFDEKEDFDRAPYNAVGGNWYNECIPYNDSTKHLLGTTDEWKGGEG